jgi:putative membrane protein
MRDMVRDHQQDIADFQKEASGGSDAGLKSFATKTLPTLQEHLRMAKEASQSVGAMSSK